MSTPTDTVVVDTPHGRLRGQHRGATLAFLGVPYGASTGGANRFRPPQPVQPWAGEREALGYGPRCPQVKRPRLPGFEWLNSAAGMDEDCLVLNVHTPAIDGRRRPVMVWLHGGGFAIGSGDSPVYDGAPLAERGDVVVVTLNHRLNVFGHLASVSEDPRFADSGNTGLLDLVAALRWVRDHIAAFGGDPGCVTLFGQSGGGAKVAVLMAMREAEGLFHRAIVQSSSSGYRVQPLDEAERAAHALLKRFDLTPARFAELQAVPADALIAAMVAVLQALPGADPFRPVIDGRTLHAHPFHPEAPRGSAQVPMLVGYAATEMTLFLLADPERENLTPERLHARVQRFVGIGPDAAQALIAGYADHHRGATPSDLLVHIMSDHMYRLTNIEGAEQKAAQRAAPVYAYCYAWRSPALGGWLRSPHTIELPFVFGHIDRAAGIVGDLERARPLMHATMDAWLRFARSGDPNGPGLPSWAPFDAAQRQTMVFEAGGPHLVADPDGATRALMAEQPRFQPGTFGSPRS